MSKIVFQDKKSAKAIEKQRLKMGLKRGSSNKKWSAEEVALLKEVYDAGFHC